MSPHAHKATELLVDLARADVRRVVERFAPGPVPDVFTRELIRALVPHLMASLAAPVPAVKPGAYDEGAPDTPMSERPDLDAIRVRWADRLAEPEDWWSPTVREIAALLGEIDRLHGALERIATVTEDWGSRSDMQGWVSGQVHAALARRDADPATQTEDAP